MELTFDIPKEEKPEYEVLVIPQERQPEEETVTTVEEIVTTVVETQDTRLQKIPETRETTQVLLQKKTKPLAPVELTFDIPNEEKPEYEVLVIPQERQPEEETVTTVEEIVTTVVETQEIPETRETTQVLLEKGKKPLAPVELTFDIPKEEKPEYEVLVIPQERQPEEETVTTVEEIVTTVVETQEIPETRETTQVLLEKGKKPLAPVELTFDIPKEEKPEYEVLVIPQERQPEEETVTTVEEIVTTVVETQEIPETRETTQVLLEKGKKPLAPVELTFDIPKEEKPEYEVLVIPQERQPEEETVTTVEEIVTTVVETQEIPETRETTQVLLQKKDKPLAPVELTFEVPRADNPEFEEEVPQQPEYEVVVMPMEQEPEMETITTVTETVTTVVETEDQPDSRQTTQIEIDQQLQPLAPIELTLEIPTDEKPEYEVLVMPMEQPEEQPEYEILVQPMEQPIDEEVTTVSETVTTITEVVRTEEVPDTIETTKVIIDQGEQPRAPVELTFEIPEEEKPRIEDVPVQQEYEVVVMPMAEEEKTTTTVVTETVTTVIEREEIPETKETSEMFIDQTQPLGQVELTLELSPGEQPEIGVVQPFTEEAVETLTEDVPDRVEAVPQEEAGVQVVVTQEPPQVIRPLEDIVTDVGETVRLTSQIVGHPQPDIQWLKHGKPVTGERFVTLIERDGNTVLLISPVKKEDETDFECIGINEKGTVSTSAEIYLGPKKPRDKPSEKPVQKPEPQKKKPVEQLPITEEVPIPQKVEQEQPRGPVDLPEEPKHPITEEVPMPQKVKQERPRGPADLPEEPEYEEVVAISEEMVSAEILLMAGEEPEYEEEIVMPEEEVTEIEITTREVTDVVIEKKPEGVQIEFELPQEKPEETSSTTITQTVTMTIEQKDKGPQRAEVVIDQEQQPLQPIELVLDVREEEMPQMPEYEELVIPSEEMPEKTERTEIVIEQGEDEQRPIEIVFEAPQQTQVTEEVSTTVTETISEVVETRKDFAPEPTEVVMEIEVTREPEEPRETTTVIMEKGPDELQGVEFLLDISEEKEEPTDKTFIEIIRHVTDIEVEIGSRAHFTCFILGSPRPTFQWSVNGRPLQGDRFISIFNLDGICELIITEVQEEDETVYVCRAENPAGVVTTEAELIIPGTGKSNIFRFSFCLQNFIFIFLDLRKVIEIVLFTFPALKVNQVLVWGS